MRLTILPLLVFIFFSCSNDEDPVVRPIQNSKADTWLIDETQVQDGGPGKDGIPALLNPEFVTPEEADYLSPGDLVIGYLYNGVSRAYPHKILDWHEIINDEVDEHIFAITYCPLTGTGTNWNRQVAGYTTTFGVSGQLYNSNLMPYDRTTESIWSQMRLDCVRGVLIGKTVETFQVIETSWETWQSWYPETLVVSENTGFSRNYRQYPYKSGPSDYREDPFLLFPVNYTNDLLPAKERVLGIISPDDVRAYRFDSFSNADIIYDEIGGRKVAVVGSKELDFLFSYYIEDQEFTTVEGRADAFLKDQNENFYNAFGHVVAGPDQGDKLELTTSYLGYWFSWVAFYPDIEIYTN
jgi:hypothetical protein